MRLDFIFVLFFFFPPFSFSSSSLPSFLPATNWLTYALAVTIVVFVLLSFLIVSEVRDFYEPSQEDVLMVNHNRGEKMKINLRITFVSLPCSGNVFPFFLVLFFV